MEDDGSTGYHLQTDGAGNCNMGKLRSKAGTVTSITAGDWTYL